MAVEGVLTRGGVRFLPATVAWCCALVAVIQGSIVGVTIGFPPSAQLVLLAALAVQTVLGGWWLTGWLRRATLLTHVSVAATMGLAVQLLAWAAAVQLDQPWLLWALPAVVGIVGGLACRRTLARSWRSRRPIGTVPALILLAAWLLVLVRVPGRMVQAGGNSTVTHWYNDLYWHLAINASAMHRLPLQDPQAIGEALDYHWFANAHVGALAVSTGIGLERLTYYAWNLPLLAVTLGVVLGLAHHLTRSTAWGALAALFVGIAPVTTTAPDLTWPRVSSVVLDSPSHMFALPTMVVVVWLILLVLSAGHGRRRSVWGPLVVALLLTSGSKVSSLPVLLCGVLAVAVVCIFRRGLVLRVAVLAGLVTLVLVGTMPYFAGGGGGSVPALLSSQQGSRFWRQTLELYPTASGRYEGLFLAALAGLCLLGLAWCAVGLFGLRRRDPVAWFLGGLLSSAIGVTFVLGHPSYSELYFLRGVQPLMAVAAVCGAAMLTRRSGLRWALPATAGVGLVLGLVAVHAPDWEALVPRLVAVVAGVVVLVAVLVAFAARFLGWQRTSALLAVVVLGWSSAAVSTLVSPDQLRALVPGGPGAVAEEPPLIGKQLTDEELEAARWVRSLPADAILATNVHCRHGAHEGDGPCDHRAFWPAAVGEHRVLLGGWAYTTLGRSTQGIGGRHHILNTYPDQALLRLNDGAFTAPTDEAFAALKERGVTHLFASHRSSTVADLSAWCDTVFENEAATVCALR